MRGKILSSIAVAVLSVGLAQADDSRTQLAGLLKAGDFKALVEEASDRVDDEPGDGVAWYFLGVGQLQLGKSAECAKTFAKTAELLAAQKPYLLAALIYQATCAQRAGLVVEAEAAMRRGLNMIDTTADLPKQFPSERLDGPLAQRALTYAQSLMALNQHVMALPWIEYFFATVDANSAVAWLARAETRLVLGDFDGALVDVRQHRKLAGKEAAAGATTIEVFAAAGVGDFSAAERALQNAGSDFDEMKLVVRYLAGDAAVDAMLSKQPRLGVDYRTDESISEGVTITDVVVGGTAAAAELQKGDVLLQLNKQRVTPGNILGSIRALVPGQSVEIRYRRGEEEKSVKAVVKARGEVPGGWQVAYREWPASSRMFGRVEALREAAAAKQARDGRAELRHLTTAFRNDPYNIGLLKRIVELSRTLKPPPAIAPQAQDLAQSASENAESADSMTLGAAAASYQAAIGHSPWWGDLYVNLALVEEKLGRFANAKRHYEMYLLVVPKAEDAAVVQRKIHEMEFRGILRGK